MKASPKKSKKQQGISVITCTNRKGFLKNLFRNYLRQRHSMTELVVVVNNNKIPLWHYKLFAKKLRNVQIFRLPERYSLGACLNFAIRKTKFSYIAKFDDDDYYAPYYLTDSLRVFKRTKADIIGKRAHYMYMLGSKTLLLRFANEENRYVSVLPGATLVFKRKVFNKVKFPSTNIGEDDRFCMESKRKGFKIYSAGERNFVAMRRKNSSNHTWIISDKELIDFHKKIPKAWNYKRYAKARRRNVRLR